MKTIDCLPMPPIRLKPTNQGHDYFEVISALQKHCRRGQVDDALYWATELSLSGYGEACWKRLKIITVEDVGQGNPNLICEVMALYQAWKETSPRVEGKLESNHLMIIEAVLRICRSSKTREADNAYGCFIDKRELLAPREIADWTKGMKTSYGKRKGRGLQYYYDVEALLEPRASIPDQYEIQAMQAFLGERS